jgi:histone H3/H4
MDGREFQKTVKKIARKIKPRVKMTSEALAVLQEASTAFLVSTLGNANTLASEARRDMQPSDIAMGAQWTATAKKPV